MLRTILRILAGRKRGHRYRAASIIINNIIGDLFVVEEYNAVHVVPSRVIYSWYHAGSQAHVFPYFSPCIRIRPGNDWGSNTSAHHKLSYFYSCLCAYASFKIMTPSLLSTLTESLSSINHLRKIIMTRPLCLWMDFSQLTPNQIWPLGVYNVMHVTTIIYY